MMNAARIHRAVWRWHFYAGLVSLPFLVLLAVTGAIYLFEDEIDHALHRDIIIVAPQDSVQPPEVLISSVIAEHPGWEVTRYGTPKTDTHAAEIELAKDDATRSVYVDPYTGRVTGLREGEGLMHTIMQIHSLALVGSYANLLIEAVAGWTIVLFATGLFLWWPRQATANASSGSRRAFWRKAHVYTGLGAGGIVAFLALTGLPWSSVWGGGLHDAARQTGLGMPYEDWGERPTSGTPAMPIPWLLDGSERPASSSVQATSIGFASAAEIAAEQEMPKGFWIEAPWGPNGVYTALAMPDDVTAQRVLHIDQYTGDILMDIRFGDYGIIAQTVEIGVGIHVGQQFGWVNKLVMLAGCIGLIMLAASSLALTWKRRSRPLAPPKVDGASMTTLSAILCGGLLLFPMTGLSAVVIAAIDLLGRRMTAVDG